MLIEGGAAKFGLVPQPRLGIADFGVALIVAAGAGWIILARFRRR
jgi:hypothetical protein